MKLAQVVRAEALFENRFGLAQDIETERSYQYSAMGLMLLKLLSRLD
jgi:hypothetical protein